MRHAVIDKNGIVANVIEWDGSEWTPPVDHIVIRSDIADIGDMYNPKTGSFTKPIIINSDNG